MQTRFGFWVGALGVLLAACAAPTPTPAAPPETAPAPAPKPEPPAITDAGAASAPAAAPAVEAPALEKKPEPEPEAEEKPSRPPIEILTSPDTAFLINYSSSAPLEAARKTCSDKGGTDDEAIAKCMAEARDAFKADVLRFKKDGSHWSCIIYKRDGSRLDEVYSARVDLSEESPSSVKIKFIGNDKGARPLLKNKRDITAQVPNDYSLVLTDPELGRLLYEAKVGLLGP
jgi:hypothetical protein